MTSPCPIKDRYRAGLDCCLVHRRLRVQRQERRVDRAPYRHAPRTCLRSATARPLSVGQESTHFRAPGPLRRVRLIPLQPCNIASPLTTASYVWGYSEFLAALLDFPREVHHLLELVTQATIDAVRAQTAAIKDLWCLSHEDWYMPTEMGIRVSDDVLAVISPPTTVSSACATTTSCRASSAASSSIPVEDIVRQIPTILENENLRAIDLALPHNDPAGLAAAAAGRVALMMRYWIQDWENRPMPDLDRYTDQAIESLERVASCCRCRRRAWTSVWRCIRGCAINRGTRHSGPHE